MAGDTAQHALPGSVLDPATLAALTAAFDSFPWCYARIPRSGAATALHE